MFIKHCVVVVLTVIFIGILYSDDVTLDGRLGVGVDSPTEQLEVSGAIKGGDSSGGDPGSLEQWYKIDSTYLRFYWKYVGDEYDSYVGFDRDGDTLVQQYVPAEGTPVVENSIHFRANSGFGANQIGVNCSSVTDGFLLDVVGDSRTDRLAIGHDDIPANCALAVNGNIMATEVNVLALADWPDYVFDDDYELRPLEEVQSHIDEHGTLPDVPSQQEIADNGVNLGELQTVTIKKLEELTLYVLELKQENEELRAEIEQIKANQ